MEKNPIFLLAAAVVAVVLIFLFFFLASSPCCGAVCTSSDPAKMPVKANNFQEGKIILLNDTGGNISNIETVLTEQNSSFLSAEISPVGTTIIADKKDITISINCPDCLAKKTLRPAPTGFSINYTDANGAKKSTKVYCQGTPI